jgi:hypothetical protein
VLEVGEQSKLGESLTFRAEQISVLLVHVELPRDSNIPLEEPRRHFRNGHVSFVVVQAPREDPAVAGWCALDRRGRTTNRREKIP